MNETRTGIGYDFHRLKNGIPLVLGGVSIPHGKGPLGHSDGDVLLHALTDALLGGVAAGDIGSYFSDADPKWKGAASRLFVEHAVRLVKKHGFSIRFVDTILVAEAPKLQPYFKAIQAQVAGLLGLAINRVSLKAKTGEGVGHIGKGEAIAAFAAATLCKEPGKRERAGLTGTKAKKKR